MPPSVDIRQRAISLVETLPSDKLLQAVELLESLNQSAQPDSPIVSVPEVELLEMIHWRLPMADQQRLKYLRQRLEAETLTPLEHQELLALSDRLEQQDARRAEAIFQLAQLRNVEFSDLLDEFLPSPKSA
jgi:hypothetical protein